MIEVDNRGIFIANWEKHQNTDKMEAIREYNRLAKQKERTKNKQFLLSQGIVNNNVNDMSNMSMQSQETEVEVDIDKELDIDINNNKAVVVDISSYEDAILKTLLQIKNWPFDLQKDINHIRQLSTDYPHFNLLEEVKKFRDWHLDKPLKSKSNPRLQLRNWCIKAQEYNERKKNNGEGYQGGIIRPNAQKDRNSQNYSNFRPTGTIDDSELI